MEGLRRGGFLGENMRLTREEQKICDRYSKADETGHVHCEDCPLALNTHYCVCKANVDVEDYSYWQDVRSHPERRWK